MSITTCGILERSSCFHPRSLTVYPRCELLLAGDCNVYMGEVMGSERERSGELRLRELIRGICADFQVEILGRPSLKGTVF